VRSEEVLQRQRYRRGERTAHSTDDDDPADHQAGKSEWTTDERCRIRISLPAYSSPVRPHGWLRKRPDCHVTGRFGCR
jgi:hypothetical protein